MKKISVLVFVFFLLASSSWQIWDINSQNLKVFYGDNPESEICFDGRPEDYNGRCVKPAAPTSQYLIKRNVGEERYNEYYRNIR